MQEQQQLIGCVFDRLINPGDIGPILPNKSRPCRHAAIHADTLLIGTVPLSPPVAFGSFNSNAVVIAHNIRQRLQSQRSRVVLVGSPRGQLDICNRLHNPWVIAKREAGPLVNNLPGAQIRVPGQTPESIEVCLRHMVAVPTVVEPDVGYADETTRRPTERLSGNERLDGRRDSGPGPQVEVENLFPHGHKEHGVTGLSHVLLGNLQLNHLVGLFQSSKKWRGWFTNLIIDGAVLDLDENIVVKLAVEILEV